MDRRTALTVLGLTEDADLAQVKQRFRALARDLHPDRGGDPLAFQQLQTAFEVLRDHLAAHPGPRRPKVARGRPSRAATTGASAGDLDDVALDDAARALHDRLVASGAATAVSRAPGSLLNRFAAALAEDATSALEVVLRRRDATIVGADGDADGHAATGAHVVRITLTGRGRAARRALSAVDLQAHGGVTWSRQRGDAVTLLATELIGPGRGSAAHRASAATAALLDAMAWSLAQWAAD